MVKIFFEIVFEKIKRGNFLCFSNLRNASKRHFTLFFLFVLIVFSGTGANLQADFNRLDHYLSQKADFDRIKINRINEIKSQVAENRDDLNALFSLYSALFYEYRSFIYDSAYVYVTRLHNTAIALNCHDKITAAQIKKTFSYLSSGLFKEAYSLLSTIDIRGVSDETRIEFFTTKARFYFDLADYNGKETYVLKYNKKGSVLIDSALVLMSVESPQFWLNVGLKRMKTDNIHGAIDAFQNVIRSREHTEHDFAIAASSIGYLFSRQGRIREAKRYFIKAAIADIKSSTKETVALRNLAQLLFEEGDITRAAKYIRYALDDAYFYNARHRLLEINQILPIIEMERMNLVEKQKNRISIFSYSISVLLLVLLVACFFIWKQLRKLNRAKRTIQKTNDNLIESNKIKEKYIGYFFALNSEFIEKLDAYQKFVKKKTLEKKYNELGAFPRNINSQKEREALYARFDQIFLTLFPDFVEKFNELLKPEEQISLKEGELLNVDLRIYALIRLGISDNDKIAQFLGYSVNTIYTYKTKVKNKAKFSNKDFKEKIMAIKSSGDS